MRHTLFTQPDVLSAAECLAWITATERRGFTDAPITTARGFVHAPEVRNNTRVMVDDPAAAASLWRKVEARVSPERTPAGTWSPVGLNERLRFYRYEPGQAFRWHFDGAFWRSAAEASRLTFMIYLNDDFDGGETDFTSQSVRPVAGSALLFSHELLHQGATVTRGVKYVLRSDVMYRLDRARSEPAGA